MKIKVTDPSSKMKTKTPVESFTNPQLDEWCARAQKLTQIYEFYWKDADDNTVYDGVQYSPTTNDAQAMGLVKEFKLVVGYDDDSKVWCAASLYGHRVDPVPSSEDLNIAICRAVIASVYGDEVEID